jgi:hypothetical protein
MDMQAKLMDHQIRPWDKLDAAGFQLVVQHVGQHATRMLASPASNKEAEIYMKQLQQFAAVGDKIMQDLEAQAQEQAEAQGGGKPMTQKEQADLQIKSMEQARKDQELELKKMDTAGQQQQRNSRTEIASRNQKLKEIATSAKIAKEGFNLALDVAAHNSQPAGV